VAFAKLYDRKTPISAAEILNDRVAPFNDEHGIRLSQTESPQKATVVHRREVPLHADHPMRRSSRCRSTTTRSRSFHNELYGRLEGRKRQLVALNARNPANEFSDVLVI